MADAAPLSARVRALRGTFGFEHAVLGVSSVIAIAAPAAAWWDLFGGLRRWLVLAHLLAVPGAALAIWGLRSRRSLWTGMAPVLSAVTLMVVTTAQLLLNLRSAPAALSVGAGVHFLALSPAWAAAGRPRPEAVAPGRPLGPAVERSVAAVVVVAALLLWQRGVGRVVLDDAGAFGLVEVAPWELWAAIVAVMVLAAVALRRSRPDRLVMALASGAFAWITVTFVAAADGVMVAPTAFVHLGMMDSISDLGFLPQSLDARFSWPGFFAAASAVVDASGVGDLMGPLVWHPLVVNLLAIPPLFAIGRALGGDERVGWLTILVFQCGNWVQQDYFAPQSVAFLMLLNVFAVLAVEISHGVTPRLAGPWWRRAVGVVGRTPGRGPWTTARESIGVELLLLAVVVGMVIGHQLTPVSLIVTTSLAAGFGVIRRRTLWLAAVVIFIGWFAFGARDWWSGNLAILIDGFGQVQESISRGVVSRVQGDVWYSRMQLARIAWSGAIGGAAALGWWLRRRTPAALFGVALVAGPVLLVGAQSYGGEILLRVFLYASPVLAVFAGVALSRLAGRWPRAAVPALAIVLTFAGVALVATRGVNTAFERTPRDVLDAARTVLAEAPPRAEISPLRTEGVLQQSRYREVDSPRTRCALTPFECILRQRPTHVFLSHGLDEFERLRNGALPDYSRSLAIQLLTSGVYRVRLQTPHVIVLVRADLAQPAERAR